MPSVMQSVGTPNGRHNLDTKYRATLDHVDPGLIKHNEIVQRKSVEEIYREKLQPAFDAFNAKQKRKDRRLDVKWKCEDALGYQRALDAAAQASKNHITKKGRPPIRELILQFGNPEQGYGSKNQTDDNRRFIHALLVEGLEEIKKRNPQFEWGDVVIHSDETSVDANGKECGSIHLHASFVPLCYENKQGPGVQVAFERCLQEMGFTSFEAWKHDLDDAMETVLQRHGLSRDIMGNTEKHQNATEYHRQQKVIKETHALEAKRDKVAQELQEGTAILKSVNRQNRKVQAELSEAEGLLDVMNDITQTMTNVYNETAAEQQVASQSLAEATETHEKVKQDVDALKEEKNALQGEIRDLRATLEQMEEKRKELPALKAQISDAADELQAMETAIKKKSQEGQEQFGTMAGFRAAIDASRKEEAKDKRIKELEKKLETMTSLIEYFVSQLPQNFRDMWQQLKERFSDRVQRSEGQQPHRPLKRMDRRDEGR